MDLTPAFCQRFSQFLDVIVHDPFISLEIIAPQPDQQLVSREDPVRILRKSRSISYSFGASLIVLPAMNVSRV